MQLVLGRINAARLRASAVADAILRRPQGAREHEPCPGKGFRRRVRARWDHLRMQASSARPGERDPLAVVIAELKRLAGDGPVPAVALTDKPRSSALPARPCRPARIEIRRKIVADGPSDTCRGEIAHEYAHVFRPDTWRHFGFSLLSTEIGIVGLAAWLIGVIGPWFDPAHRARAPLYLGFLLAGMLLICAGVYCSAWASHRRELRADALAAELLGDAGPVLAMLDDFQAKHEELGRMARLCGLLTHPSPARRRRELLGAGVERSSARALREAVR
jgi:Zn-dependent protease with chaperone function